MSENIELSEFLSQQTGSTGSSVADQIIDRLRQKYKASGELVGKYSGLEQELFNLPSQMETKYPTDPGAEGYVRPQAQRSMVSQRESGVGTEMSRVYNLIKNEAAGTESAWNALLKTFTEASKSGSSLSVSQIRKELEYAKYKYWAEKLTNVMTPGQEGLDGAGDLEATTRDIKLILQQANAPRRDEKTGEITMEGVDPDTFADLQDLVEFYEDELWSRSATREEEAEPTNIFSKGLNWLLEHLI